MRWLHPSLVLLLVAVNCHCEASLSPSHSSTAEGPTFAAVSAAVSAAKPGDTVVVPAGSATWDRPLIITKSIVLIGAGIGQTVITSNYTTNQDTADPTRALISFKPATPADNPPFRLSGMTIDCASKCDGVWLYNDSLQYPCTKIRLDHLRITNCKHPGTSYPRIAVGRHGTVYGVCDSSYLNGMLSNSSLHALWTNTAYNFGDEYNFYYEDCEWNGDGLNGFACDGNQSPRYCLRHNTIDVRTTLREYISPMCDLHGNQIPSPGNPAGGYHASQGGEIYENTILVGTRGILMVDQRGGRVLCYNNAVTGSGAEMSIRVREEHDDRENPTGRDARGVAGENLITGQPQHISDSYYWNNTLNGTIVPVDDSEAHIIYPDGTCPTENLHFWNQSPSFDGTSGIGVGSLANRPTTCTVGVAYWATDMKILYRCTSTNVWTEFYRPFPYPHPLRNAL